MILHAIIRLGIPKVEKLQGCKLHSGRIAMCIAHDAALLQVFRVRSKLFHVGFRVINDQRRGACLVCDSWCLHHSSGVAPCV
jgi:hypothetical protein